jgi:PAS domain S-box-containing protein
MSQKKVINKMSFGVQKIRFFCVLTCSLIIAQSSFGQGLKGQEKVDSLITVLISLEKSFKKADVLNQIAIASRRIDYHSALKYGQQSLEMSTELKYDEGIISSSLTISKIYSAYFLNYYEAIHHLSRALEIGEEKNDSKTMMEIYQEFAFVKYSMGNFEEGLEYNKKAITIAKEEKDYDCLSSLYGYTADIYYEMGDKKNALEYYSMTFALYNSDKLKNPSLSLPLSVAMYYRMNGFDKEAIVLYKESIEEYHADELSRFESYAYSQLGHTYMKIGEYHYALEAIKAGLEIAQENNIAKEKLDNYKELIAVYDSLGDYKKTYINLIKYTKFKDSLNTSQAQEQTSLFQSNYEEMVSLNKMKELKEQQKNHELEIENSRLNRNFIIGILVFVVVIVILMILRLRYKNKKEKELRVLSLATSHTTNSIILFDKDIKVEWVNKGFESLTGLKDTDVKGKYFLDFYNGDETSQEELNSMAAKFKKQRSFTTELASYHRETDNKYWISMSITPLFDENNRLINYVSVAADITQIHNAQTELEKVHEHTMLLNEIGKQITSSLSVFEIIEKVYENVNKLMSAHNMGIGIHREAENELYFPEPIEKGNKLKSFSFKVENQGRVAVKCFLENLDIIVGTKEEIFEVTGESPPLLAGAQPESLIYVPLISKWKTMGVLSVQSFEKNAYGEAELSMVKTLATYVAIALENAGLYETMEDKVVERTKEVTVQKEQLQKNFENIKLLSEIGIQISSSLEFEDIFMRLHTNLSKLMDADIFGIRIYHEDRGEVEYKFEIENGKRDSADIISMEDKDNYSVWCIENKKEIFINDNEKEFKNYVNEIKVPSGDMPNSLIFYPMIIDRKVLGLLTVQSFKKNAYTAYHLAMIKTLASYTGSALNNAKLYDTLEQKVEERTAELAQKNKDIMASINYAKRIQGGILPSESFMKQLVPETFVLYRPRDVISGDFYWFERSFGKVFFAVVDCTGHGVPGALMSVIGKNILDQAVNEKGITDPAMILTFLRLGLRIIFGADEEEETNEVEDGMDLGVCVLDVNERTVDFAGAHSNLYLVRDGILDVIKGDKSGVSASDFSVRNYTTHSLDMISGDTLYLSSDGFPDQFGGDRMKKYSQKRFQEFLHQLSENPMDKQHDLLEKELISWMGEYNQLDDICVLGVKI